MKKLLLNAFLAWVAVSAAIAVIVQMRLVGRLSKSPLVDWLFKHPAVRTYAQVWRQVEVMLEQLGGLRP